MNIKVLLVFVSMLLTSALSITGYNIYANRRETKNREKTSEEQDGRATLETTPTSTSTPTPTLTVHPTKPPKTPTLLPTSKPIPTNSPIPTRIPNTENDTNNESWNNPTNPPTSTVAPTGTSKSGYKEWSAKQPKDSRGVLCINPDSRCKYECSVSDFWVDDHLRILNNHLREYQMHLEIYGSDANQTKNWDDAVMNVYNMIYEECKNSPIYTPDNPL